MDTGPYGNFVVNILPLLTSRTKTIHDVLNTLSQAPNSKGFSLDVLLCQTLAARLSDGVPMIACGAPSTSGLSVVSLPTNLQTGQDLKTIGQQLARIGSEVHAATSEISTTAQQLAAITTELRQLAAIVFQQGRLIEESAALAKSVNDFSANHLTPIVPAAPALPPPLATTRLAYRPDKRCISSQTLRTTRKVLKHQQPALSIVLTVATKPSTRHRHWWLF